MYRNANSHFAINPTINIPRSKFVMPFKHSTTCNAGLLIPTGWIECIPGDTISIDLTTLARMTTPIHPTMDNAYIDTFAFSIPYRLVWKHFKEFMGENKLTAWETPTEYQIPQVTAPENGWAKGTIADYLGIPTNVPNLSVNALLFRMYALVWREWFRSEALQDGTNISLDDETLEGSNGNNYVIDPQLGGMPLPVSKFHDYFTSALPEPQRGPSVELPLGNYAKVTTSDLKKYNIEAPALTFAVTGRNYDLDANFQLNTGADGVYAGQAGQTNNGGLYPTNLIADLGDATAASINQLRQAFAIQSFYERDARGGTRYTEIIKSHFGVTSPDARLQRPEYLGGERTPININQVVQTSSTDSTSPQGNTAGYSVTGQKSGIATYSATEHGVIMTFMCIRNENTYQQGLHKFFSKKNKFDFYFPEFSNLGEQPIMVKEIYATGTKADEEVFGYQEAWADYRYLPNRVSGAFRSNYATTLDSWHYADYYTSQPILGPEWIKSDKSNIDRTLAVQSSVEDQFIVDMFFNITAVRPIPMYSIPGLKTF